MLYGIFFYWISWFFWIIATFIMKKNKNRTVLASTLLIIIISSHYSVEMYTYKISIAFIFILFYALFSLAKFNNKLFYTFISFTIMIGYMAILLWEKLSPVWMFLPRTIVIPILITLLISMLSSGMYQRLMTGILGVVAGELLFNLTISTNYLEGMIGDLAFLDHLFVIIFYVFIVEIIQSVKQKVFAYSLNNSVYRWKHE